MSHADDYRSRQKTSVAGFLFMPQFRMCFQGFSHLFPVFMRCLAQVFAEAKLIPPTHNALNYGAKEVPNTHLFDLFGTAWFTLRVTRASAHQWSMFTGVVLMVMMMLLAVGSFFLRVVFGVGNAVQAQLFLPRVLEHPCNPYGGCTGGPGETAITGGTSTITAPGGLFDTRVNDAAVSTDYALMVFDKILRQAATAPVGNGGILQNALVDLMRVYNTGMTLIAGVVTLWMITSIVIATARTGKLGGGRHNMVWAPIRMIFALGIIFPLGAQGFSAGQYMVMKLAEWGSNLGTKGWVQYIGGVVGDQNLLAPFSVANATSIAAGVNKVMVCQIAFNSALQNITGGLDPQQVIRVKQDTTNRTGWVANRYTNNTDANICGTITYGFDYGANSDAGAVLANTGVTTPMDPASATLAANPANRTQYTNTNTEMNLRVAEFRSRMLGALPPLLSENMDIGADIGSGTGGGQIVTLGRQLACGFVARRWETTTPNPVGLLSAPYAACPGGTSAPAADPDASIPQRQVGMIMDAIRCTYDGSAPISPTSPGCGGGPFAKDALMNYVTGPNGMVFQMQRRGWAGMGMWYQEIASLNSQVAGSREPVASVEPGTLWEGATKGGFWQNLKCAGRRIVGRPCKSPEIEEKAASILGEYDAWWATASRPGAPANTPLGSMGGAARTQDVQPSSSGGGLRTVISVIKSVAFGGGGGLLNWVTERIMGRPGDTFIFSAVDTAATNTYPLAQLTSAGYKVIYDSLRILAGLTIIQILTAGKLFTVSGGIGFAASAVANILSTLSTTMLVAGVMIAFYLPVLPFLRVAFAVLTWMTSVFEAVLMVPIAALTHLGTEGEGLAGGARTAWILWLNVLMRPILVVFGFVGGMLIFNAFATFFHTSFAQGAQSLIASNNAFTGLIASVTYSVVYLGTLYTAANTSFKLMDVIPNAMMRWMGGSPDHSMDDHNDGNMLMAAKMMEGMAPKFEIGGKKKLDKDDIPGVSNAGGDGGPKSGGAGRGMGAGTGGQAGRGSAKA
ncbi:MAG: putative rane protein [Alphaproteobacteria bacterium]|nr:putative rane protein [Alphaproteobacteria bacterium]